ncbi:histone H3-like centromeric protein CSE4 isoform X2 [Venturia canescens]|nr:histone H3-like centromeric protein CSE4 isoform X2 [Venturia canescens]
MVRRKSTARSHSGRSASTAKSSEPPRTTRTEVVVNKRRSNYAARALQEIKFLRKTTKLLIPKLPFARLVREIIFDLFPRQNIAR